jgi:hypothetical protein
MVNPTPTSFYADGTVYDEAQVVTNDHQSSSQASAAPSSFFTDGGLVGAEDVTHNDVAPSDTSSPMPSSFFTDGGLVGAETVTNNDQVPDSSPSPAPTSFYPDGNLYDYLSQESEVVALLRQLADTTTTNANAAAASATNSATSASNSAASAAQAATAVQGAAGTATPRVDGTATVGTSTKWAHEDHVHPTDASLASAIALKADQTYVDTHLTALQDYTDIKTAPKADKTYVDAQDATKASTAYVDAQDAKAVRWDMSQTLTVPQQTQALTNIGAQPAGSYQTALGYTPVNKAGDTMSGSLTISGGGYLAVGGVNVGSAGDLTLSRPASPTSGVLFLGNTGTRYLFYDGTKYNLNGAQLLVNGFNVVSNVRLVYVTDYPLTWDNGLVEPYGGAVLTGCSGYRANQGDYQYFRFRYVQYQLTNGGWYTAGYA